MPSTRTWRPPTLILCLAAVILCLAGCGETAAPGSPPGAPPPTTTGSAPQPSPPGATPTPAASHSLKIVTYNVLADIVQPDGHGGDRRWPALFALIEKSDADILCLQEVRPAFLQGLAQQPWFKDRYQLPRLGNLAALVNGNIVLTRTPIDRVDALDHHSSQGRQSIVVWTQIQGRKLAVATCHLESMLEDGPIRAQQLDDLFAALKDADDCILAGDFNFGDGEIPDSQHLAQGYTDLWLVVHPNDPGFTWNIQKSAMAAKGSFTGEGSRRIDRILMKSKDGFWHPAAIHIIGDEPLTPGDTTLFPSDHFGLCGSWSAAPAAASSAP